MMMIRERTFLLQSAHLEQWQTDPKWTKRLDVLIKNVIDKLIRSFDIEVISFKLFFNPTCILLAFNDVSTISV